MERVSLSPLTPTPLVPHTRSLVIWWNNACRSVMPMFRELAAQPGVRVRIVLQELLGETRRQMGWSPDSSGNASLDVLSDTNWKADVDRILSEEKNSIHIFGGYQRFVKIRYAALQAVAHSIRFGIMAEAPLNMSHGPRWFLKELYLRRILPARTAPISNAALFMMCMSGRRTKPLTDVGWPAAKVYSFGYFPAARPVRARVTLPIGQVPRILALGYLHRFKGIDLLLGSADLLKRRNIPFVCDIVGDGPDRARLTQMAQSFDLGSAIQFHGFVPDAKVEQLIQGGDILVSPGYYEPWAIRINEGIHAGMAVVTSDRLGGADLVRASCAGDVFRAGDAGELAECLGELLTDPARLQQAKANAVAFVPRIEPAVAARYMLDVVRHSLDGGPRPHVPWDMIGRFSLADSTGIGTPI